MMLLYEEMSKFFTVNKSDIRLRHKVSGKLVNLERDENGSPFLTINGERVDVENVTCCIITGHNIDSKKLITWQTFRGVLADYQGGLYDKKHSQRFLA